jgi:hypothetical protein
MVFEDRIEIIKLFISVLGGIAAGNSAGRIFGDSLSTILVSASAIVIIYYILGFIESFIIKNRND